jgi:hypothetical protein
VVEKMPKFTFAMGEKPEKTVTYILDVLGRLGQQWVVLKNTMRVVKDTTGNFWSVNILRDPVPISRLVKWIDFHTESFLLHY